MQLITLALYLTSPLPASPSSPLLPHSSSSSSPSECLAYVSCVISAVVDDDDVTDPQSPSDASWEVTALIAKETPLNNTTNDRTNNDITTRNQSNTPGMASGINNSNNDGPSRPGQIEYIADADVAQYLSRLISVTGSTDNGPSSSRSAIQLTISPSSHNSHPGSSNTNGDLVTVRLLDCSDTHVPDVGLASLEDVLNMATTLKRPLSRHTDRKNGVNGDDNNDDSNNDNHVLANHSKGVNLFTVSIPGLSTRLGLEAHRAYLSVSAASPSPYPTPLSAASRSPVVHFTSSASSPQIDGTPDVTTITYGTNYIAPSSNYHHTPYPTNPSFSEYGKISGISPSTYPLTNRSFCAPGVWIRGWAAVEATPLLIPQLAPTLHDNYTDQQHHLHNNSSMTKASNRSSNHAPGLAIALAEVVRDNRNNADVTPSSPLSLLDPWRHTNVLISVHGACRKMLTQYALDRYSAIHRILLSVKRASVSARHVLTALRRVALLPRRHHLKGESTKTSGQSHNNLLGPRGSTRGGPRASIVFTSRRSMMRLVSLRYLISFTLENILVFFESDVVEDLFAKLLSKINEASSMSGVVSAHSAFLDTLAHRCLVNDTQLLSALTKITDAAHKLALIVSHVNALRIDEKVRILLLPYLHSLHFLISSPLYLS